MRLSLFAGLAALAAAVDFDDDDINFLRMLQSNGSNQSATTVMMNTTGMPMNTTVAPATTPPGGSSNATTPMTATTPPGAMATTASKDGGGMMQTTVAPPADLCIPATYTAAGFATPAAADITQQSHAIGITGCADGSVDKGASADTFFTEWGVDSQTTANKAKCGTGAKDLTCAANNADLNMWFAQHSSMKFAQGGILGRCCGKYPSDMKVPSTAALTGVDLVMNPSITMGLYSDAECATALTTISHHEDSLNFNPNPRTVSGCVADTSGMYMKYAACNATTTSGALRGGVMEQYFDSGCTAIYMVQAGMLQDCKMQNGMGGNATVYEKQTCSGGSAVTVLEINNDYAVVLEGITAGLPAATQSTILTVTCNKLADVQDTASGAAGTTTTSVKSCQGTGNLAGGSFTARRVRRLGSHDGTRVNAVITSVVPVASADTVRTAMVGAAGLNVATLATSVLTALQADDSITSAVGNITVTAAPVTIGQPVIATPIGGGGGGGGGSTSGAVTQFVGMGAALLLGAFVLI